MLCCIELMVNSTFISPQFCVVSVCVSITSFSGGYYGHLKFCASFQIEQGGLLICLQILRSSEVLGSAADLMRLEGFVVLNFSIHPKEEEKVLHRGGRGKKNKKGSSSRLLSLVERNDN